MKPKKKQKQRERIKRRVRSRIFGTSERPRLTVFRSLRYIYAQVIDDERQQTVVAASTLQKELRGRLKSTKNIEAAKEVGRLIAKRALEAGVKRVVFDRGAYRYHGRIKALADAARETGLQF